MNPPWAPLSNVDKIRLLRLLAAGDSVAKVATTLGMPSDRILNVAKHHGYPDVNKIAWAVELLEAANKKIVPAQQHQEGDDVTRALVARGRKGQRAKTRALAEKVVEAIKALRAALDAEEAERLAAAEDAARKARERAEQDARDQEAKEEIRLLEQRLAAARAKLAKKRAPGSASGGVAEPKKVRAWAAANGVECGAHGRVPAAVIEQYLAAVSR